MNDNIKLADYGELKSKKKEFLSEISDANVAGLYIAPKKNDEWSIFINQLMDNGYEDMKEKLLSDGFLENNSTFLNTELEIYVLYVEDLDFFHNGVFPFIKIQDYLRSKQ